MPVTYSGIVPDLFREGQGVVAEGRMRPDGVFVAREVLAKHDEKYMPPEVADALNRAGARSTRPKHLPNRSSRLPSQYPARSRSSAMIPEIGHYALVLALFLALVQSVLPLVGAARGNVGLDGRGEACRDRSVRHDPG